MSALSFKDSIVPPIVLLFCCYFTEILQIYSPMSTAPSSGITQYDACAETK